jgi:hypothetical protein
MHPLATSSQPEFSRSRRAFDQLPRPLRDQCDSHGLLMSAGLPVLTLK